MARITTNRGKYMDDLRTIIMNCKKGCSRAESAFFKLFEKKAINWCRRYIYNAESAEDCQMKGFENFFENISSFTYLNDEKTENFLKTIVRNVCLKFIEEKSRRILIPILDNDTYQIADHILERISVKQLLVFITQLKGVYRTVLNCWIDGMTHAEIAKMINKSEWWVW